MQSKDNLSSESKQPKKSPIQRRLPGIDFAPDKVVEHGLREAHTFPLVSSGKVEGIVQASFRVHASTAWSFPSVELRSATAWPALVLDCDGTTGYSRLMVAVEDREIPMPNWVVHRDTGGAHAAWCLSRPVLRGAGARARPLKLLTRATEFMAQKVEADAGFTGVLSHNPMVPDQAQNLRTDWLRRDPYSLTELGEIVPLGWKLPIVPATGIGRNCSLFTSLMRWAGRPCNKEILVFTAAMSINSEVAKLHGKTPLESREVAGIAQSVERYRRRWIELGKFYTEEERSAWGRARGLKGGPASGEARRKGTPLEHDREPWLADGVSRATWYRRRHSKQLPLTFGTEATQLMSDAEAVA